MDLKHLKQLNVGCKVNVKTESELLCGIVVDISIDRGLIEIDNVQNLETNYTYNSSIFLNFLNIKTIQILKNSNNDLKENPEKSFSSHSLKTNDVLNNAIESTESNSDTDELIQNITIINKFDKLFNSVVQEILAETEIVLHTKTHNRQLLSLIFATNKQTFVFDVKELKLNGSTFMTGGLNTILVSLYPRKIVYNGSIVKEELKSNFDLQIGGMIDTLVLYKRLVQRPECTSLAEIIEKVMKVPTHLLSNPELETNECNVFNLKTSIPAVSQLAALHFKLFQCIVHKGVLTDFYKRCANYAESFAVIDDRAELMLLMSPHRNWGIESIDVFKSEWKQGIAGIRESLFNGKMNKRHMCAYSVKYSFVIGCAYAKNSLPIVNSAAEN